MTIESRMQEVVKGITAKFGIQCKAEVKEIEQTQYIALSIVNGNRFEVNEFMRANFDKTFPIVVESKFAPDVYAQAARMFKPTGAVYDEFHHKVVNPATFTTFQLLQACEALQTALVIAI